MWNLPPPPGFQGFRDDLPVRIYQRHLPHWRQNGATYSVTFRQCDALPQAKLRELSAIQREWELQSPKPRSNDALRKLLRRKLQAIERWLDRGYGSCVLRQSQARKIVSEALHCFDGQRYELGCWVIMPNHVHCILRPLDPNAWELEQILKSWKSYSSLQINRSIGATGTFWQNESYDQIVRNAEHLWNLIQYIGRNPRLGGVPANENLLWIKPEWEALGWKFVSG